MTQTVADALADAPRAARYDGDLILEIEHSHLHRLSLLLFAHSVLTLLTGFMRLLPINSDIG